MIAKGLRDYSAVSWAAADAVEPMSDVDLKINLPVFPATQLTSPTNEVSNPSGLTFTHAATQATALSLAAELRPGELCGIWRREWIMDDASERSPMDAGTIYSWS